VKTGWFGVLCLLSVTSFVSHPNYQLVNSASVAFSLRGPTHCFSVGVGYDSKFLFSIRSLGYTGRIDFEVSAPDGIEVDLKTPVFLNSTGVGAYCPITVRATSKANYGNQSIRIMARGETYTDSITVCILVVGFTTLTMQTSPIGIAVDVFLDNTKYQLRSEPLVLRIRAGHHSIQLITNSSTLGSNNYVSEGLDFTNIDGNTTYYASSGGPLTLDIVDKSTITIRFREGLSSTTETAKLMAPVSTDMVLVSFIVLVVVILAAIAVYFWRRQTRVASVEGTKDNDAPVASIVLNS
jgi:hypothetical protein